MAERCDFTDPSPSLAADGTPGCLFGCINLGEHDRTCPCTTTCPTHDDHCTGCAPRPAYANSLVCGSCFHRRLRRPLRQLPGLYDWLELNKAGLKATTCDRDMVTGGTKEAPLPFRTDMHDLQSTITLLTVAWADRAAREAPPGPGPTDTTARAACVWLDQHAGWIAEQPWLPTLVEHLGELMTRGRGLAPWQPTKTHLPLPCTRCEQLTLVLYGGEDWVTCTSPECDNVIGYGRYSRLVKQLNELRTQEAS